MWISFRENWCEIKFCRPTFITSIIFFMSFSSCSLSFSLC